MTGTLLSRSIVIHMERAPRNSVRKSTRLRSLERDAKILRERVSRVCWFMTSAEVQPVICAGQEWRSQLS